MVRAGALALWGEAGGPGLFQTGEGAGPRGTPKAASLPVLTPDSVFLQSWDWWIRSLSEGGRRKAKICLGL